MTDPVETDALRERVWRRGVRATVVTIDSDELESAADEVDRLRAVIEDAPHYVDADGWWCQAGNGDACTCWKADAL